MLIGKYAEYFTGKIKEKQTSKRVVINKPVNRTADLIQSNNEHKTDFSIFNKRTTYKNLKPKEACCSIKSTTSRLSITAL